MGGKPAYVMCITSNVFVSTSLSSLYISLKYEIQMYYKLTDIFAM